jgi:hypothetical protein
MPFLLAFPSVRRLSAGVLLTTALISTARAESIARIWDGQILDAIRIDFPNPPVHARNLFHLSVAMWDAWAAYDGTAVGYAHRERATAAGDVASAREEAISYAAYRVLSSRYALSADAPTSLLAFDDQMAVLGYDVNLTTTEGDSPAAVGNRVAAAVLGFADRDGSREASDYDDPSYVPVNPPLILDPMFLFLQEPMADPNRWQPLLFAIATTQNGLPADRQQTFVGSHWGVVRPFAMTLQPGHSVYFDPGPPPQLGENSATDAAYKAGAMLVLRRSRDLDPDNGVMLDISPGARGNNTLGQNDGTGRMTNPATSMPYAANIVPLGDYARVLAEFWADGPHSETPPGHWNTIANAVVDHPSFQRRIGGTGPLLDELEWDVKMYLPLNAAVHDAAIAAWGCKRVYDSVRPISAIRHMGGKGQSSDPGGPLYNVEGLPLEPGLVEVTTAASVLPGGRHAGLPAPTIAVFAWGGEPADPENNHTGAKWIEVDKWAPYQRSTFVTPAFAGYISGHSTFSRAAAEVLAAMTGSPFFPGGMGTFAALQDDFLDFENGPSVEVRLQWATYFDAADEAGLSRLYGGIHVPADDGPGRIVGSQCGRASWAMAQRYFDGSILEAPLSVDLAPSGAGANTATLRWPTVRGLRYTVESTTDLVTPFAPMASLQAGEVETTLEIDTTPSGAYFRIRRGE